MSIFKELFGFDLIPTLESRYENDNHHYSSHEEVADVLINSHNLKVRMAERAREQKIKEAKEKKK